ncbi:hypothetical protein [Chryseobacterium indoltheticum]|jgi:hypothetical protein|uniref:hypothetical protein n=1 Tax=Chryseobacterium indoltheticum TaxID=254 RepID=UPI00242E7DDE|nr:hypothetical protein [Chryseobacterium indoltheticum]MDF2832947.1 hypothetical protein [Chryseobacterium indoltheticum]
MIDNFDLFNGTEKFDLILKKIEDDNKEVFREAMITYDECCTFFSLNNKISLVEVNNKLPNSIKNLIDVEWKRFCNN